MTDQRLPISAPSTDLHALHGEALLGCGQHLAHHHRHAVPLLLALLLPAGAAGGGWVEYCDIVTL